MNRSKWKPIYRAILDGLNSPVDAVTGMLGDTNSKRLTTKRRRYSKILLMRRITDEFSSDVETTLHSTEDGWIEVTAGFNSFGTTEYRQIPIK